MYLCEENVSCQWVQKYTFQSTTYNDWTAGRAVDGNTNGSSGAQSCSLTQDHDKNPWWAVDLFYFYMLTSVKIYHRVYIDGKPTELTIGMTDLTPADTVPTSDNIRKCGTYEPSTSTTFDTWSFDIRITQCDKRGRYFVVLLLHDRTQLSICEVILVGTKFDGCESQPCKHGSCVNHNNSYTCACDDDFGGVNCESKLNECKSHPCQSGGTCTDERGGFYCKCPSWATGTHCELDANECLSLPCVNSGLCVETVNGRGFSCDCAAGYTGIHCETGIDECLSGPCQNNGTCVDIHNGYKCDCRAKFIGKFCEKDNVQCRSGPCQNNGTCIDIQDRYKCDCSAHFSGQFCEIVIDDCASRPCLNNGLCVDGVNRYSCKCPTGYDGDNCETTATSKNSSTLTTQSTQSPFRQEPLKRRKNLPGIIGGVAFILVIALIGAFLWVKYRWRKSGDKDEPDKRILTDVTPHSPKRSPVTQLVRIIKRVGHIGSRPTPKGMPIATPPPLTSNKESESGLDVKILETELKAQPKTIAASDVPGLESSHHHAQHHSQHHNVAPPHSTNALPQHVSSKHAQPKNRPTQPQHAQPQHTPPHHAQPQHAQPQYAQSQPAQPQPAQSQPAQPQPAQPKPAQPQPAQPQPAQPQPAQPQPAQPQPAQPQPAQPQPAQPQPAQPQPAQPQPAQPQPAQPQPAQPQPAQPQPAQPHPIHLFRDM